MKLVLLSGLAQSSDMLPACQFRQRKNSGSGNNIIMRIVNQFRLRKVMAKFTESASTVRDKPPAAGDLNGFVMLHEVDAVGGLA